MAALLFGLLWMAGCGTQRVPTPAAQLTDDATACMQVSGKPAAGLMQFQLGDSTQALPMPAPGGDVLQRYGAMWPDAVLLAPTGASAVIVLSAQQAHMHVLDRGSGALLKQIPLQDRTHRTLSYAGAVESVFRRSILIRFEQAELWELFLTEDGPAIYEGLVHDFRLGEGLREAPQYPVRRITLDAPILAMASEPGRANLLFTQVGADGVGRLVRFNLDVRRPIGQVRTRSPLGKMSLGRSGDIDFVMLANAEGAPEVFRLPELIPLDWRTIRVDGCGAR